MGQSSSTVLVVAGAIRHRVEGRKQICRGPGGSLRDSTVGRGHRVLHSGPDAARDSSFGFAAGNRAGRRFQRQDFDLDLLSGDPTRFCQIVDGLCDLCAGRSDVAGS